MSIEIIITISTLIVGWLGFLEKRFSDMRTNFETRLTEKNEINKVIQDELKGDIARLENKIDMLLAFELQRPRKTLLNEFSAHQKES